MPEPGVEPPARPDLYVLARFLDRLAEPGATWTRSSLQPAVRLNYDLYRRYLAFLEEKAWIAWREGERSPEVMLTAEGREARRRLVAWLQDVFGAGPW